MNPDWASARSRITSDPLDVLKSTAAVMASASDVQIDMGMVNDVADQLSDRTPNQEWDASLHYRATGPDGDEQTAMWILILDALNFCFWGQGTNPEQRWRVEWQENLTDGYMALVAALKRGVVERQELLSASWLANVSREGVAHLLRPAEGQETIPLFESRVQHLRELGRGLLDLRSETPATTLITSAQGSAIALVREVIHRFPSFNDVAQWPQASTGFAGNEVRFFKRAQILAGDLAGGLAGSSLGAFHDLDHLTAFADYKVPQVLRQLGILHYSDALGSNIASRTHVPAGSRQEVEIRAGTIWGCELLRQALACRGKRVAAHELDWLLWEQGQSLPVHAEPYHLTPTVFY